MSLAPLSSDADHTRTTIAPRAAIETFAFARPRTPTTTEAVGSDTVPVPATLCCAGISSGANAAAHAKTIHTILRRNLAVITPSDTPSRPRCGLDEGCFAFHLDTRFTAA